MPKGGGCVLSVGVGTIRVAEKSRQTLVVWHVAHFSVFYSRSASLVGRILNFGKKNAKPILRFAGADLRSCELLKRTSLICGVTCLLDSSACLLLPGVAHSTFLIHPHAQRASRCGTKTGTDGNLFESDCRANPAGGRSSW